MVLCVIIAWQMMRDWWWRHVDEDTEFAQIEIPSGYGVKAIATLLTDEGVIRHPGSFTLYMMLHGLSNDLHAGTFILPKDTNFGELAELLQDAQAVDISITIPEGYTVQQIGEVLASTLDISVDQWMDIAQNDEGYLFPDTYRFAPTVTVQDIRDRMRDNFDVRMQRAGVSPTRDQIIIASILEREVRRSDEMSQVSDIIRKRLDIGMALQMDSTVNYVTQASRASATYEDIDIDSPYNTYKYPGLPPGPISNPGLNAIQAAINPSSNPYYYFLTDAEGRVYYAETFDGHIANRKYLN